MANTSTYQVIVGNLGTVCDTSDKDAAANVFDEYVRLSKARYGRVANEPVTIMEVFPDGTAYILTEHESKEEE